MATRNIVPRATGEGNIGTSTKKWLSAFFTTINLFGEAIMQQISTPSNPSSGYNKLYFKSDGKLYKLTSAGVEEQVGAASSYTRTFTNSDLSTGVLTVTHSLNQKVVVIQVYDNNDKMIIPDEVTLSSTSALTVDLTSYSTLTGTWNLRVAA